MLFVFLVFISTPTIIWLVDENSEISLVDDLTEEKEAIKDLKIEFNFTETISINKINFKKITTLIISKCKFKHEMISSKIFIPPPELT
jgi:hypothetical protein